VTLAQHQDLTLAAGAYGVVKLSQGSAADPTVLSLSGGIYDLMDLDLGDQSRLECAAPCELRIEGRLSPGQPLLASPKKNAPSWRACTSRGRSYGG
jgi:hypothetical protein